jgi:hypothetical protein
LSQQIDLFLTVDGFTEPELERLVNQLFCAMVFLLHHEEVSDTEKLEVSLTDDKADLRAWSLSQYVLVDSHFFSANTVGTEV